jgi:hypothetical protein
MVLWRARTAWELENKRVYDSEPSDRVGQTDHPELNIKNQFGSNAHWIPRANNSKQLFTSCPGCKKRAQKANNACDAMKCDCGRVYCFYCGQETSLDSYIHDKKNHGEHYRNIDTTHNQVKGHKRQTQGGWCWCRIDFCWPATLSNNTFFSSWGDMTNCGF